MGRGYVRRALESRRSVAIFVWIGRVSSPVNFADFPSMVCGMGGVLSPLIFGAIARVRYFIGDILAVRAPIPLLAVFTRIGSTWCLEIGRIAARPGLK